MSEGERSFSRSSPSRSFECKYEFRCGCCDEWYPMGTTAQYMLNGVLVASECNNLEEAKATILRDGETGVEDAIVTEAERKRARERMCPGCFLELPASGVCGVC